MEIMLALPCSTTFFGLSRFISVRCPFEVGTKPLLVYFATMIIDPWKPGCHQVVCCGQPTKYFSEYTSGRNCWSQPTGMQQRALVRHIWCKKTYLLVTAAISKQNLRDGFFESFADTDKSAEAKECSTTVQFQSNAIFIEQETLC